MKMNQDVGLGTGIILLSGLFFTQAGKLPENSAMYPKWLLYLMTFSGVCMIIRACLAARKGQQENQAITGKEFITEIGIPGGILLAACFLIHVTGFYICSFFILCAISVAQEWIIEGAWKPEKSKVIRTAAYGLGVTAFMYICFSVLLSLPTPKGVLGF